VLSGVSDLELFYSTDNSDSQTNIGRSHASHSNLFQNGDVLHYLFLPQSESLKTKDSPSRNNGNFGTDKSGSPEGCENPEFSFGLSLLQANVLVLCIKAGVSPNSLFPPEAILLNLDLLQRQGHEVISGHNPIVPSLDELPPITSVSLIRVFDPYPHLQQEGTLNLANGSIDMDDGVYVFSDGEEDKVISSDSKMSDEDRVLIEPPLSPLKNSREISDGQEWALIGEEIC
jgi:hypothetical protein